MSDEAGEYLPHWPRDVLAPATVHEFVCGMYAVHEAAHAVAGGELGLVPVAIRVHPSPAKPGAVRGTLFATEPAGDLGATIALAARPAVDCYLRLTGQDTADTRARCEPQFAADDELAAERAQRPLPELRAQAEQLVDEHWTAIVELASRVCRAGGGLRSRSGSSLLGAAEGDLVAGEAAEGFSC